MEVTEPKTPVAEEAPEQAVGREVTVHRSAPGRAVFTEKNNTDGWIATDHTVDLRR